MKYVESNLLKGEEVKYTASISIWALIPRLVIGVILLPFYGIGLIFIASAAITYYSTELALTNKRIIAKFGFISRNTIELNLSKIESVQVVQGILGRIFNYGNIIVSGAGNPQAPIPFISNPLVFRSKVFELQEAE